MKKQLKDHINAKLTNTIPEEVELILEIFEEKAFEKGDMVKSYSTVSKELGFVLSGSLRVYALSEKGNQVTGRIVEKNDFVADIFSIRYEKETPVCIECLEETKLLMASVKSVKRMLETNLTLNRLIRENLADHILNIGEKQLLLLNGTAKERYMMLLESRPHLLKKIPLRFIASMIGITPTQLSRIRKNAKK